MLKVVEVAFSCYAVTDFARARSFYEGVLGLTPSEPLTADSGGHWMEYEIGPQTLSIGSAPGFKPSSDGCTVALEVEDFDGAIAHLHKHNVKFRMEPFQSPVCRMAMVYDPDQNVICIHKRNAK
jgi:predicted enzyme related to lactoylglutathione lyase